jgi:hypothetical protein
MGITQMKQSGVGHEVSVELAGRSSEAARSGEAVGETSNLTGVN